MAYLQGSKIIISCFTFSGDDIIDVLKGAAVEPDQWHQYILYCLMGGFLMSSDQNNDQIDEFDHGDQ